MYTVSFFGHREVFGHADVMKKLQAAVSEIMQEHDEILFFVGRNVDFDKMTAQAVRNAIDTNVNNKNYVLRLVLPYETAEFKHHLRELQQIYDEITVYEPSKKAHFKAAVQIRNRFMIDTSDMIVCYILHAKGGAYQSVSYAEKQNKKNLESCRINIQKSLFNFSGICYNMVRHSAY